ncbi:MAG: T9SS type A sorting domain-containing protein [Ignavibacteriae bacterium]|nr:T9SS type A sorting domain-containing protein [Ignavibacteriota bacterium]MCB9243612.1 T9SS type A sorting domain-containing protein [Ignavibacteriales bacterium]
MKKVTTTVFSLVLLLIMMYGNASAQLTGTKTIPGTYASIKLAVDDLNANGVGTGGVTFNITPGYTETIPMGGLIIDIAANLPTSGNPVVFQRNGAGTNPVIQTDTNGSGVLSSSGADWNGDAILKLVGTDYITINNIDFIENYTGGNQTLQTESGIRLLRKSSTDGCKNVQITGCTIQQQQNDQYSACISSLNRDLAGGITNPTTIEGRHENVSIQGCTMNNSRYGIFCLGYNAPSPYDLYDHFFDIGGTTGNTIINIGTGLINGGGTSGHRGISVLYQDSLIISNNTIRVNTGTSGASPYPIFLGTGLNSSATVNNNDMSDTLGGSTTSSFGIFCDYGKDGVNNTVNITNNKIHDCRYDGATLAPTNASIYIQTNPYTLNITGNTIRDNYLGNGSSTATGSMYGIYMSSSNTNFGSSYTVSNNTIKNLRRNQSTPGNGNTYCIYVNGGAYNYEVSNNTVDSIFSTASTGSMMGIACAYTSPGMISIHDNTIGNLIKESGTTGSIYGIYNNNNTDTLEVYNNEVFNLYNNATTGLLYGYYNSGILSEGYEDVYNNKIHDLTNNSSNVCIGMNMKNNNTANTQEKNVYGNLVYNIINDSIGQTGGIQLAKPGVANISANRIFNIITRKGSSVTYGLYFNGASNSNCNIYNNMISEIYAPVQNTTLGVIGLVIENSDTVNLSYNTIYMDSSSTGANSGNIALYISGFSNSTLKNNIVINKFTPSGGGQTIAIFKDPGVTYNAASNNNNIYVPAGASNFYYCDGSNFHSTFAAFQTAVSPADTNSFSENSPFKNVSTSPYDLDMKTTIPTLCDGGAIPVAGITTDIHGTTRNVSTPDVGADEFELKNPVTAAPTLVYPANNAVLVEVNPLMNWDEVTNATIYHIQISTDSTFGSSLVDVDTLTSSELQLGNNFLAINTKYYWRVSGKNPVGEGPFSSVWNFTTGVTNIEPTSLPVVYELYQNYPNPFNPSTKIKFDIPKSGFVSLKVYDITGREVSTLVNSELATGRYEFEWNGGQFASGVYFFRITAGDFVKVQKMILVK